jgi:probable phosphoglycerate mutase
MTRRLVFMTRHGETDWNLEGRWQGHTDVPLNDKGRAQARAIAEALRDAGLAGLVSSDLSRARETAEIVGASLGLGVAYVDPDLRERMFGVFEGLTGAECERLHPEAWRAWVEEQRPADGVELPSAVAARVTAAIGRAVQRIARDGAPVLLVSHGGALRSVVHQATRLPVGPIANGAIYRIEWDAQHGIVRADRVDAGVAQDPWQRPALGRTRSVRGAG